MWAAQHEALPTAYVALFNTGEAADSLALPVSVVHAGSTCAVMDLWTRQDLGRVATLRVSLAAHASALFALSGCS